MVEKSLLSFSNNDREFAIWTIKNDSEVDKMNQRVQEIQEEIVKAEQEVMKLIIARTL